MKKILAVVIVFVILWVAAIMPCADAYATAGEVPLTGNTVTNCTATINLVDTSTLAFTDDVKVIFTDISLGKTYEYTLKYAESYGFGKTVSLNIQADTTYNVSFDFPHSNVYSIVNSDGSAITKFAATADGVALNWNIIIGGEEKQDTKQTTQINVSTGNDEADQVFSSFLSATKNIETDSSWDGYMKIFTIYSELRADYYIKYCGGSKEEWIAKSPYEQFLYYELYLRQCDFMESGMNNFYYGSEENFIKQNISTTYKVIKKYGEAEAEAYKTIMLWQYEYIKANGAPYNFMTGLDYLDVVGKEQGAEPAEEAGQTQNQEQQGQQDNEPTELTKVDQKTADNNEPAIQSNNKPVKEEKGIWNDTVSALKGSVFSIILLVILVIGLIAVIIYHKKKNSSNVSD